MFIAKYEGTWLEDLASFSKKATSNGNYLYLLLDGAFIPSFHKRFLQCELDKLFRLLPGFDERAESVSPFLLRYDDTAMLNRNLDACNGWPMVSAIETPELMSDVATRLAACTIIEAGGQRFNLRLADTRRIEVISEALSETQKNLFFGPISKWFFVNRNGKWSSIDLDFQRKIEAQPNSLIISDEQYAKLIDDSVGDEILAILKDYGVPVEADPSGYYGLVMDALGVVEGRLEFVDLVRWVAKFLEIRLAFQGSLSKDDFISWRDNQKEFEGGGLIFPI